MKRRALIIYCDNTQSGQLPGAVADHNNMRAFLKSEHGGNWYDNEILSLRNPTDVMVKHAVTNHFLRADYTFVVFSGHGYFQTVNNHQYLELSNNNIPLRALQSAAKRQTMIIDACRGFYLNTNALQGFRISESSENFIGKKSTRKLFEHFVKQGDYGLTIMYSAKPGQSSIETVIGGAYISSLLTSALHWSDLTHDRVFSLLNAHNTAKQIIQRDFQDTIQIPVLNREKRRNYFPFAVKF